MSDQILLEQVSRERMYGNCSIRMLSAKPAFPFRFLVWLLSTCLMFCQSYSAVCAAPLAKPASTIKNSPVNRPVKDKWALVIGVGKFDDPKISKLRYPAKDARDFAEFLVTHEHFARDHVRLLTDERATKENILDALGDTWLPKRVLEDDLVVIYISTHGSAADKAEENFIVAYDTNVDRLFSTGIKIQDLASAITRRTGCDRVVLILDACHSGAAELASKGLVRQTNFDADKIVGSGLLIITSSQADEVSWESKNYENGVFTKRLMEALQANGPNTKLLDAFNYLREKVEQEVKFDHKAFQRPVMKSAWKGDDLRLSVVPIKPRSYPDVDLPIYPSTPQTPPPPTPVFRVTPPTPTPVFNATPTGQTIVPSFSSVPPGGNPNAPTFNTAPAALPVYPTASATVTPNGNRLQGLVQHSPLPNRIVMFRPIAPSQYELSASGGYPAASAQDRIDVTGLPSWLYGGIDKELRAGQLGSRMVPNDEILAANPAMQRVTASGAELWKQVAQIVRAKYLIKAKIDRFAFSGKVMSSNDYIMEITVELVSGVTGEVVWTDHKRFHKTPWASDGAWRFPVYLNQKIAPSWSRELAKLITKNVPNE